MHPFTLHPFSKIRCSGDILILNKQSKYSFPELCSLFKSSEKNSFSDIFYKRAGIHKFLELLINIVMSLTNYLCVNSFFVNEHLSSHPLLLLRNHADSSHPQNT